MHGAYRCHLISRDPTCFVTGLERTRGLETSTVRGCPSGAESERSPVTREERFSALAHEHSSSLLRYLRRRHDGTGATSADDVLSDVLLVAWRRFDDIPEGLEAPWLFNVAQRCLANDRRKQGRRKELIVRLRARGDSPSAEEEALAMNAMRSGLAALKTQEREALLLSAWEGLSPQELAIALGISENAAAIRLSKAKTKLQSELDAKN